MKNLFIICLAALGMFSCSNDQTNDAGVQEIDALKIQTVQRSNTDEEAQKVGYRLLNEEEKLTFWKERMNQFLQDEHLNSHQKELIEEFRDRLSAPIFSDTQNDEQEYFKNIFVPNFLERIKNKFSFDEIEFIFYSARPANLLTVAPIDGGSTGGGNGDRKKCNCNQGSLFGCGASRNCRDSKTCDIVFNDCGFAWVFDCDGLCNLYS